MPLVAIIAGAALVAAGLLKLGRYTRFVSYSVMTGFLTGVAVKNVCGQIPDLTGAKAHSRWPRRLTCSFTPGIGVALSLPLQLNRGARDLSVVELVPAGGGRFTERSTPATLPSDQVTILDVYGSLLYAGSRTLQARLPDPAGSHKPAVVLRLRGRTTLGATFLKVITGYAERLAEVDGQLYLSGLDPGVAERLRRTGRLDGLARILRPPTRRRINRSGPPRRTDMAGAKTG